MHSPPLTARQPQSAALRKDAGMDSDDDVDGILDLDAVSMDEFNEDRLSALNADLGHLQLERAPPPAGSPPAGSPPAESPLPSAWSGAGDTSVESAAISTPSSSRSAASETPGDDATRARDYAQRLVELKAQFDVTFRSFAAMNAAFAQTLQQEQRCFPSPPRPGPGSPPGRAPARNAPGELRHASPWLGPDRSPARSARPGSSPGTPAAPPLPSPLTPASSAGTLVAPGDAAQPPAGKRKFESIVSPCPARHVAGAGAPAARHVRPHAPPARPASAGGAKTARLSPTRSSVGMVGLFAPAGARPRARPRAKNPTLAPEPRPKPVTLTSSTAASRPPSASPTRGDKRGPPLSPAAHLLTPLASSSSLASLAGPPDGAAGRPQPLFSASTRAAEAATDPAPPPSKLPPPRRSATSLAELRHAFGATAAAASSVTSPFAATEPPVITSPPRLRQPQTRIPVHIIASRSASAVPAPQQRPTARRAA